MAQRIINEKLNYTIIGSIEQNLNNIIESTFNYCKVLFLVEKSKINKMSIILNQQKSCAKNNYEIMVIEDNIKFSQVMINSICEKMNSDYAMIVAVGENEVLNFTKVLAKHKNICYGYIPTILDNISMASNFIYSIEDCQFKKIETNYPFFILFDFSVINSDSDLIIQNQITALNFCLLDNELICHYFGLEMDNEKVNEIKEILSKNYKYIKKYDNDKKSKNIEISEFFAKNCEKIAFFSEFYCQIQNFLIFFNSILSKDKSKLSVYTNIFLLSILNFYMCFFSKLSHIKFTTINLQRRVKFLNEQNIPANQIVNIIQKYSFEYDYKKFYFISKNLNRPFKNEIQKNIDLFSRVINFYKNFEIEKCFELSNEITAKKLLTDISYLSDFLENNNFLCILRNFGFLEFN